MSTLTTALPVRRTDLVIRPLGENGRYVVKDPSTGSYFQLGEQEHFLLRLLDGEHGADAVCRKFEQQFAEPLSGDDLDGFIALARRKRLLRDEIQPAWQVAASPAQPLPSAPPRPRQSILYWRKSLFDPDRFCTWLEPRIRFFWTKSFLLLSAGCILLAIGVVWAGRAEAETSALAALRWETAVAVWLTLFVVTMLHEFAHGLTCKHYGGEVHEIGFLLMFFMPCFYCNVSDAWLFRERAKRLWVTFAGGYFEAFVWALAVFIWRLTARDSLPNFLSFVVLSVCGVQTLFNFNPLLKLDGYYLLSDWLEIPNLRLRAWEHVASRLRWLLWGAPRPARHPASSMLLGYGLFSWLYSFTFLSLMLWAFFRFLWSSWGWPGLGGVLLLATMSMPGLFRGLSNGEVQNMLRLRHKRTAMWIVFLGTVGAGLHVVEVEDRSSGPFLVRPVTRAELRAEVAGFVREIQFDEGDRVSPAALVARLEIPDLTSRIAQKRAETREAEAKLRLLEAGPRPEEVVEQRARVERMKNWRDLAAKDLVQGRQALEQEFGRLDQQTAQFRAELSWAESTYLRSKSLRAKGSVAEEQYQEAERKYHVAQASLAQAEFQKRHREALGTREAIAGLDAEAELARREKDLADAQSTLTLLEAGTRSEEIAAQQALLDRLREEAHYLESLEDKLRIRSPVGGLITTAHLKEKIGQYFQPGDLLCVVEEPSPLEVEIVLTEQETASVEPGQPVALKARALPFATFATTVERIAPSAARDPAAASSAALRLETHGTLTVYCQLTSPADDLRPGMTGYARVYSGKRSLDAILLDRGLRWLRTEFWW
jgi:multidrug efflux pump subunit AcrA (membrane-fusion protein)